VHLLQLSNYALPEFQRAETASSGPMLDCIDIQIEVPRVDYEKLSDDRLGEPSANVQGRVETARERQRLRFGETELACNAEMRPAEVRDYCQLDQTSNSLMRRKIRLRLR
jgi:magnesium chelatase family protein